MHILFQSDLGVMTSYFHKDNHSKPKTDRFILNLSSQAKPFRKDPFANGQVLQKSELGSDDRTHPKSNSHLVSATSPSTSPECSYPSTSKQKSSDLKRNESNLRSSHQQVSESLDYKRFGTLEDSPKWARIKGTFENVDSEATLPKRHIKTCNSSSKLPTQYSSSKKNECVEEIKQLLSSSSQAKPLSSRTHTQSSTASDCSNKQHERNVTSPQFAMKSSTRFKISESKKTLASSNMQLPSQRSKFESVSDIEKVTIPRSRPDMESINSLRSCLKDIQDSKRNREKFFTSNPASKEKTLLNTHHLSSNNNTSKNYIPSHFDRTKRDCSKHSEPKLIKSSPTRSLEEKSDRNLKSAREYSSFRTHRDRNSDTERNIPQTYYKKVEEIHLSQSKHNKEHGLNLEIVTTTSYTSDVEEPKLTDKSSIPPETLKLFSPRKSKLSTYSRPKSEVVPLKDKGSITVKIDRGISFDCSSNSSKNNAQSWKLTSSGSWVKNSSENDVTNISQNEDDREELKTAKHPLVYVTDVNKIVQEVKENVRTVSELVTSSGSFNDSLQSVDERSKPFGSSPDKSKISRATTDVTTSTLVTSNVPKCASVLETVDQQRHGNNTRSSFQSIKSCSSENDKRPNSQDFKESVTYSSFPGKSKLPSNHKLTVHHRLSGIQSDKNNQRPSVPPPEVPSKRCEDFLMNSPMNSEENCSLLAEIEMWYAQKYNPNEQQPNESFLWKKFYRENSESEGSVKPDIKQESLPSLLQANTSDKAERDYLDSSFQPPEIPVRYSREICFQERTYYNNNDCVDKQEPGTIKEEAKKKNGEQVNSCQQDTNTNFVRQSWIDEEREKSLQQTGKNWKNVTVYENKDDSFSSSSSSLVSNTTTSDHLYEALYEVITPEKDRRWETKPKSVCSENVGNITPNTEVVESKTSPESWDELDNIYEAIFPQYDKNSQKINGNSAFNNSDNSLDLESDLSNLKARKDSQSTDVSEPQSDSEVVTRKKNVFMNFLLRQKKTTTVKKSDDKTFSKFYIRWPKDDSESNEGSACSAEESSEPETRRRVATVKRRASSSGSIRRPTTPPPLPPASGVQVRQHKGAKSLEFLRSSFISHPVASKQKSMSLDSARNVKLDLHSGEAIYRNDSFATRRSYPSSQGSYSPSSSSQSSHDTPTGNVFFMMPKSRYSVASSLSSHSGNSYIPEEEIVSISKPNFSSLMTTQEEESSDRQQKIDQNEQTLLSPFKEEPLYQFYTKGVKLRATKLQSLMVDDEQDEHLLRKQGRRNGMIITTSTSPSGEQAARKSTCDPNLSPTSVSSACSNIPTAMELLCHDSRNHRKLWCEVPEVYNSGILDKTTPLERKLQEAMFEVITSEVSYLKSLNVLIKHFMECPEFSDDFCTNCVLDRRERRILFSDVIPVQEVSARLLNDLERRWKENIYINNICDILYEHASKYFGVYIKYCANQVYQDRLLKEMKATRPDFINILHRLESDPVCQGLDMLSFLMLPMQRITRMPLLIDAIFHRLSSDSPYYDMCKLTLQTVNKIVSECNEAARKMERMEEMLIINRQLDFKFCKSIPLISASRWLVKKGELVRLVSENAGRNKAFGRTTRYMKIPLYLFLFSDLLLIAKKRSEDAFVVLDYCPRNFVQVFTLEEAGISMTGRIPESHKHIFQLTMLQNYEFKTIELILGCPLESDRTRWMEAVTPPISQNPEEKIYEEWDCPQVQCIYPYNAKQPDELTLEESDVVNVFRKINDGWYEGERLRDGVKGWFPASFTIEIISTHIRARNLRQRYRLLMLSQAYVEEQRKCFLLDKVDKFK